MKELTPPMPFGNAFTVRDDAAREVGFPAFMERQFRFVFQVAWSVLRNVHDAEDVVQETFLKLYRSGSWRQAADQRAFLARAAWRLAVARSRANRRPEPRGDLMQPSDDPERIAIAADRDAAIHRLIDALPDELRIPLALSAIDDLNSEKIAVMMGISAGTVRTRIMRARQILKQKMGAMTRASYEK